jgi:hypothetical protein
MGRRQGEAAVAKLKVLFRRLLKQDEETSEKLGSSELICSPEIGTKLLCNMSPRRYYLSRLTEVTFTLSQSRRHKEAEIYLSSLFNLGAR